MTIVLTILGIVLFILGLLITVGLHELGHLLPAKKFGVKVPKYFIGFGATIWSITRAGTEYGIKAVPLGGFVQLAGMLAPASAGTRLTKKDGSLTLAEQARRQSADELAPGEEHNAFWRLPARKKLAVMFGGPFVNLVLSVVLTVGVMCGIGWGTYGTRLAEVSWCISGDDVCDSIDVAPGAAAGLEPGDTILSWGGTAVTTWEDVQSAIAKGGTMQTHVEIERRGERLTLTISPVETDRPMIRDGAVVTDPDTGQPRTEKKPYVGISPQIELQRQSLSTAFKQVGMLAVGTFKIVAALPQKLWATASDLISGEPRDANGVVGIVGVADMAGSITSAHIDGYGFAERAADFLMLMASLNMSLFVFNMIPLLPLDGGHILGACIEGARRVMWRWRGGQQSGRPAPGPFDTARLLPLSYVVIGFFVLMTLLLVVADILNPVV